jgi:hypothetical protein
MPHIQTAILRFPHLKLSPAAGHKLRGYFAGLFGEESDLFHQHETHGKAIYRYPLIQYKVAGGAPLLLGLGDGAAEIIRRFRRIEALELDGRHYPLDHKHLHSEHMAVGHTGGRFYHYQFATRWMALNQANFQRYQKTAPDERKAMLERLLTGNLLSTFKGLGVRLQPDEQIVVEGRFEERISQFKNKKMLVFGGGFWTNVHLPPFAGLGKSVSRGFGAVALSKQKTQLGPTPKQAYL